MIVVLWLMYRRLILSGQCEMMVVVLLATVLTEGTLGYGDGDGGEHGGRGRE